MHKMWKGSKGRGQGPRPQVKPDCWLELRHSPGRSWLNVLSGALTLLEVYRITGPGPIRSIFQSVCSETDTQLKRIVAMCTE